MRDRRHRAAAGRRPGRRDGAAADGGGDPPPRARTASGSRSTPGAGLVSTRLAIFDLPGGWQPLESGPGGRCSSTTARSTTTSSCGRSSPRPGERFATTSDTEVVLRLLERDGLAALERFNGQFAFAWWQPERRRLTLVRDRFGVRPLFTTRCSTTARSSSARRPRRCSPRARSAPRPTSPGSTTSSRSGAPRPPRTAFAGVEQLAPGRAARLGARARSSSSGAGGSPTYQTGDAPTPTSRELLRDSVRLRLRADVPVGAYLSGGLDSSLITALAQREKRRRAADLLGRLPGPALRRARPSGGGRAGARHAATTWSRSAPAEIAGALPGRRPARRDAAGAHRAGAAVPARRARCGPTTSRWWSPARAPTSCSGATTCSRRSACASSARREPERAPRAARAALSLPRRRRARVAARPGSRFLLETGAPATTRSART